MSGIEQAARDHYGHFGPADRIAAAVAAIKTKKDILTPDDLGPFDQLHTGGPDATRALIARFGLASNMHVLDIGSGLGGPARMLSAATGARVSGIDLTPHFVETAQRLTEETGQTGRVDFRCASALELPFGPNTFDAAWHIHMSMHIADKARLYAEIFRVLKPGARFAFYDPIRGDGGAPIFPVPWADSAAVSYLRPKAEMLALLTGAGFAIVDIFDATGDGLAWFAKLASAEAAATPEAKARSAARADPRFAVMSANHQRNLESGAVAILGAIARKPD